MKDFSTLRMISTIFKISGIITVVITIAFGFFALFQLLIHALPTNNITLVTVSISVIGGILLAIFQFAISEIILLFLQIEINTQHQQININSEREPYRCNNCGHEQSLKFDFCPKCGLDEYGLSEKESRQKRLTKEVEDEQYREKIRGIIGKKHN